MSDDGPSQVTTLLKSIAAGDSDAKDKLFAVVYEELRRAAAGIARGERPGHTLQPTALVHEAYFRLMNSNLLQNAANRKIFFGAACRAMREILIDHARHRKTIPRGGQWHRTDFDAAIDAVESDRIDLESLAEAMKTLERLNPRQHQVIDMGYFGGFAVKEVAELLDVSVATVEKDQKLARAFLLSQIKE